MLKTRLLAAAVLMPAAIAWVWLAPLWLFALVAGLVVLGGAWEWGGLASAGGAAGRVAYAAVTGALMALSWFAVGRPALRFALLCAFLAFWLAMMLTLRVGAVGPRPGRAGTLVQGWLVLVPAFFALVVVRRGPGGPALAFTALGIVWAADAAAYFAGRAWGRHKLAPALSPGKTWEGAAGALAAAAATGALASLWSPVGIPVLVPLAAGAAVFSIVGDLAESRLKRLAGAKDSGSLIPGHGGILDRVDSITAAAPVFALGLELARRAW